MITFVLAAASGAAAVMGALLFAAVLAGWEPPARKRPPRRLRADWNGNRWLVAAGAGIAVWAGSSWPVAGLGVCAGVVGLPIIFTSGERSGRAIDRLEGLAEWTRRVADLLAVGFGLEAALVTAADSAPALIRTEATNLASRISARGSTEDALRRFAGQLADPAADLVVAALILAARRRGPGLPAALTAVAAAVSQEAAARRRVEADRAKPRTTAKVVSLITVAMVAIGLANRSYTAPFATPTGQLVLALTLAFFGACLWWMHAMTSTGAAARLIAPAANSRERE